jgi:hypothetical protein
MLICADNRKKELLFLKKEAKNFCPIGPEHRAAPSQSDKSFLVLFFKKEHLPSCRSFMIRVDDSRPFHGKVIA